MRIEPVIYLVMILLTISIAEASAPTITDFYCTPTTVNIGKSVTCHMEADDETSVWFDIFCQYDLVKSPQAYYPTGPYPEYASRGWLGPTYTPAQITMSCPTNDRGQWGSEGNYTIRMCVTDGDYYDPDHPDGQLGFGYDAYFGTYSQCREETITVGSNYRFEFQAIDPEDMEHLPYSTVNPRNKVIYWTIIYTGSPSDPAIDGDMTWILNNFDTGAILDSGTFSFTNFQGANTFNTGNVQIRNGYNYSWQVIIEDEYGKISSSELWRFSVEASHSTDPIPEFIRVTHVKDGWGYPSGSSFDVEEILLGNVIALSEFEIFKKTRVCFWWWNQIDPVMRNSCQIFYDSGTYDFSENLNWMYHEDPHFYIPYYWQSSLDDYVHNVVYGPEQPMNFTIIESGNQPPTLTLNSPQDKYVFPTHTRNITLSATVNDTDDSWVDIVFKFDEANVPEKNMKTICSNTMPSNSKKECKIPSDYLYDGRQYKWCVYTNDKTIDSRIISKCRTFTIYYQPSQPLPEVDSVTCNRQTVGINQTVECTVTGHDPVKDTIYFDLYCEYLDGTSFNSFYGDGECQNCRYASNGWQKVESQSGSATFTCPNSVYTQYGQWQSVGVKNVVGCITNGDFGFNSSLAYGICQDTIVTVQEYQTYGSPDSLELPFDTRTLLEQFYNGMIIFFRKFFMPFLIIMALTAFAVLMFGIYKWVKEQ